MPGGDGTGPDGKGPKTGRGFGKAIGNNMGRDQGSRRGQGQNRNIQFPDKSGRRSGKNSG